jgi:hypothetical protein
VMTIKEGFVLSTVSSGLGKAGDVGGVVVVRYTFLPYLFLSFCNVFKCSQHCDTNFVVVKMFF